MRGHFKAGEVRGKGKEGMKRNWRKDTKGREETPTPNKFLVTLLDMPLSLSSEANYAYPVCYMWYFFVILMLINYSLKPSDSVCLEHSNMLYVLCITQTAPPYNQYDIFHSSVRILYVELVANHIWTGTFTIQFSLMFTDCVATDQRKQQQQQSSAINVVKTAAPTCSENALIISTSSLHHINTNAINYVRYCTCVATHLSHYEYWRL